jgi:hypothetical protein
LISSTCLSWSLYFPQHISCCCCKWLQYIWCNANKNICKQTNYYIWM